MFSKNIDQLYNELLCNFIEITLQHGCSHVNLLHIFSTTLPKITYGGLLLFNGKDPEVKNVTKEYSRRKIGILVIQVKLGLT